jgi:GNAT superfamily N-acetyltransferase
VSGGFGRRVLKPRHHAVPFRTKGPTFRVALLLLWDRRSRSYVTVERCPPKVKASQRHSAVFGDGATRQWAGWTLFRWLFLAAGRSRPLGTPIASSMGRRAKELRVACAGELCDHRSMVTAPETSGFEPALAVVHFPPADALAGLVERARELHRTLLDPTAREFPEDNSRLAYVLIIAHYDDGDVVGYASFVVLSSDQMWWAKWVLVDPKSRGNGIGRSLLKRAGEEASANGVRRVCLVPLHETPDIEGWYVTLGFEVVEDDNSTPRRYLCIPAADLARI